MAEYLFDKQTLAEKLRRIEPVVRKPVDALLEDPRAFLEPAGGSPPTVAPVTRYRWPVRRNDEGCTGFTAQRGPGRASASWQFPWSRTVHTRFPSPPIHAPVIWNDYCIFTDQEYHTVIAVDRQGQLAWTNHDFRYETEPVVGADGTVYVGAYLVDPYGQPVGFLVALEAGTGKRKWAALTGERFATLSDLEISRSGQVFGVLRSGEIYAVNPATGSDRRLGGKLPNGWPLVWYSADVLAYGELVYTWSNVPASGQGNTIYISAFEEPGGRYYRTAPPLSVRGLPVPNGGLAMAPPVPHLGLDHRLVFTLGPYADMLCFQDAALQHQARVIHISRLLGRLIFIEQAPAIAPTGEIFLVGHDGGYTRNTLIALDPGGNLLWQRELMHAATAAPVMDGRGLVYVGTRNGIQCFDMGGSEQFRFRLHLGCSDSLSMDDGGRLYFHDGGILCAVF